MNALVYPAMRVVGISLLRRLRHNVAQTSRSPKPPKCGTVYRPLFNPLTPGCRASCRLLRRVRTGRCWFLRSCVAATIRGCSDLFRRHVDNVRPACHTCKIFLQRHIKKVGYRAWHEKRYDLQHEKTLERNHRIPRRSPPHKLLAKAEGVDDPSWRSNLA